MPKVDEMTRDTSHCLVKGMIHIAEQTLFKAELSQSSLTVLLNHALVFRACWV